MASTKKLRGGKLVHRFRDEERKMWSVYEADRITHPHLFDGPNTVGCMWPKERKIFIDSGQGEYDKWDTLVHELMHASLRELGMNEILEEEFVTETSRKLARYLDQCLMGKVY